MVKKIDIINAKKNLDEAGVVKETPTALAPKLTELCGCEIYLKKENLQFTGAYKLRGAYNKISSLSEEEKNHGVIAASAGNHAQGVAFSAKKFGIMAKIVMPEATPLLKVLNTKEYGAEVILYGENYDEAYSYAMKLAREQSLTFIHPFADDKVISGQGTVGLEVLEQLEGVTKILVPIGGGGLINGIATYVKATNPDIKIIGVTAKGAPAMYESFQRKRAIDSTSVRTIADGIAVKNVEIKNFEKILELVDEVVSVSDEEIANAILFLLEKQKLVVEGAGAVGVASLLHQKIDFEKNDKIVSIISGGNIDVQMLSIIIEKGLIKSYRKMKIKITLIDKPGALMKLTDILTLLNANITKIDYDRTSTTLSFGDANVTMALETKGREHQNEIRKALNNENYIFEDID